MIIMSEQITRIPVQIQKVLELEGVYSMDRASPTSVYAHISKPVKRGAEDVQYAMLAIFPRHGFMNLGEIDPETRVFEHYDPDGVRKFGIGTPNALYVRAGNHVVNEVSVPHEQIDRLKTMDEVLGIDGIFVKRELIPE
jgi:hypothetical protein